MGIANLINIPNGDEWIRPPYSWFEFEDNGRVLVKYEKVLDHPGCVKSNRVMDIETFKLCYKKWILEEDIDPNKVEDEEKVPHKVHENPVITCIATGENRKFVPVSVSIDIDNPISIRLRDYGISGTIATITWLIKHMISATVIVDFEDPPFQRTIYNDCELKNLRQEPQDKEPYLVIGKYSEQINQINKF